MSKRAKLNDGCKAFPHIVAVRAYVFKPPEGDGQQGADCHDVAATHWINGHPTPIANPMSGYPQHRSSVTLVGRGGLGRQARSGEAMD